MGPEANIYEDLGDNAAEDAGERLAAEGEVLSFLALLAHKYAVYLLYCYKFGRQ